MILQKSYGQRPCRPRRALRVRLTRCLFRALSPRDHFFLRSVSPAGITVNDDESGLAVFSGGCKCCTIPGGYVGGSFWGALFVALSGNRYGATAVVGLITMALLLSLL